MGSVDEINFAMCLAIRRREEAGAPLPRLLAYYKTLPVYGKYKDSPNVYAGYFDEVNLIPEPLLRTVREEAGKAFAEAQEKQ